MKTDLFEVRHNHPEKGLSSLMKNGEYFAIIESCTVNDSLLREVEKLYSLLETSEKIISMFTDQKSKVFPFGRIIKSYGVDGCKDFHHVFNDETQRKAREWVKYLNEVYPERIKNEC